MSVPSAKVGGNFVDTRELSKLRARANHFLESSSRDTARAWFWPRNIAASSPATDPNAAGNHRKNMIQSVEASLKRLETDYIDLYWVHIWDQITPVQEVMRGLRRSGPSGKVLHVGISDAPAWPWIAQAKTSGFHYSWRVSIRGSAN